MSYFPDFFYFLNFEYHQNKDVLAFLNERSPKYEVMLLKMKGYKNILDEKEKMTEK